MEIQEIKQKLTLSQVLKHYGLKPDKNLRLNCPFHPDRTPSLQVYYKTHTAYCFSTNCKTHGKAIDVIDFIMYQENCSKHEAIEQAKVMAKGEKATELRKSYLPKTEIGQRVSLLTNMFTYFKNAVYNSKPARAYLEKRCLDFQKTEVGYNSGQFHHGNRKDEQLIENCVKYGLLLDLGLKARTGNTAYKPFGKWGIVFALRNIKHEVVSLYFRSIHEDKKQRHFYLRDRQGLYPCYPNLATKKLILTESIIDAATLLEQPKIAKNYAVLALFGTNGLTEEHQKAIKNLAELQEIIFFLNGDAAGKKAVEKYAPMLKTEYPEVKISHVAVPENEDVNSLLQGHSAEILSHLIESRKEYDFLFSIESSNEVQLKIKSPVAEQGLAKAVTGLDTNNPYNLKYKGKAANYQIKGFKLQQLDSLKITLQLNV